MITIPTSTTQRRIHWPILLLGMVITGVVALSIHVIMLEVLHVPFPEDGGASVWVKYLNFAGAIVALTIFCRLASPRFVAFPFWARCLVVGLLFAMLKETFRGLIMQGVVTDAWTFALLVNLPEFISVIVVGVVVVVCATYAKPSSFRFVAAAAGAALIVFALKPALGAAFGPWLEKMSFLARPDAYHLPYPWQVLVPAYISFSEPVIAAMLVTALVWDRLSTSLSLRVLQVILLLMFIKGAALRILLYSSSIKGGLLQGMLSESQFTLESLALACLSAIVWHLATRSLRL